MKWNKIEEKERVRRSSPIKKPAKSGLSCLSRDNGEKRGRLLFLIKQPAPLVVYRQEFYL